MFRNIIVVFGGKSCEHDVSIISGVGCANALSFEKYNIIPVYAHEGRFYISRGFFDIETFRGDPLSGAREVFFADGNMLMQGRLLHKKTKIEAAVLATHGGEGENGEMQGYFEVARIPHTSCPVAASAICMDKLLTKVYLKSLGIPSPKYVGINSAQGDLQSWTAQVQGKLPYPVIVKPALLGSSIGITRCNNSEELQTALSLAARFGKDILVEQCICNFAELNIAVARLDGEVVLSDIERVFAEGEVLTFEDKYLRGAKSKKQGDIQSTQREIPANIEQKTAERIQKYAKTAYEALNMSGVVRMDFLVTETQKVYLNEINTVPGSLAHYLFPYTQGIFLDKLIQEAVFAAARRGEYIGRIDTQIFAKPQKV